MISTPTTYQSWPPSTTHDVLKPPTQTLYGPFRTPAEAAGADAVNRSSLAALAFLVWDILITFDEEVKYIWPRAWSYTKRVYFFVRYVPVMVEASILCVGTELTPQFHFTQHDCFIWQVYQATAITLIIIAVDTILIIRVRALFENSHIAYTIVRIGFVAEIICMTLGIVLATPKVKYNDICLVTHAPRSFGFWLFSLIFQALLFFLTAYRFYTTLKAGLRNSVPLVSVIMRDGSWAFLLLFLIYIGYTILVVIPHHSYSGLLFGWLLASFSFAGYRIILNLHHFSAQHTRTTQLPSHHTRQTNTDIQFTSHPITTQSESYELQTTRTFTSRTSRGAGQISGLSAISELQLES